MRKTIATILLVQQAIWLLVVAPGHTRGAITLPGTQVVERSCCGNRSAEHCQPNGQERDENRAAHCAICSISTCLSPALPPDLTPRPSAESISAVVLPDWLSPALPFAATYDCCGPPAA